MIPIFISMAYYPKRNDITQKAIVKMEPLAAKSDTIKFRP